MSRAETIDKGHGRIETRMIAVRTRLPARLDTVWPDLAQIVRIERRRELKTPCQRQVIHAITSLPPGCYDAETLLAVSRNHWQIENRLFHVRDVTFKEDASRIRSGNAPSAVAHPRNATLTVIRNQKLKPRPAREAFAANPKAAIRLITRA